MNHEPAQPPVPDAWLERTSSLVGRRQLNVAGLEVAVDVDRHQVERVDLPLLAMLDDRARTERVLAGLAGIPGSGKSTFAAVLAHIAEQVLGPGALAVVGMDGWHWPNAVLDARTTLDGEGREVPLSERKGGPESYDAVAVAEALGELRHADKAVAVPVYDRTLHEPVADDMVVPRDARIVLVEGNYVLGDEPPWDAVSRLLSPKLFLECDADAARRRVIERHVRGGLTPDEAARKYDRNDRLNCGIVEATADRADGVIRLGPDAQLIWARS